MDSTPIDHTDDQPEKQESQFTKSARQRFLQMAQHADSLRKEISEASTRTKKNYLRKKLKKNNDDAINILMYLEAVEQQKSVTPQVTNE